MYPLSYLKTFSDQNQGRRVHPDANLSFDTENPNLNSQDFFSRANNRTICMYNGWECVSLNSVGNAAIASNKISGREWTGSLWIFDQLEDITAEKACLKIQCNALISQVRYVTPDQVLLSFRSGAVQLWSTNGQVKNGNLGFCAMLSEKCEHSGPIECMDISKTDPTKVITCCKKGGIRCWSISDSELYSTNQYRFAHLDAITGVDSSPESEFVFVTSSLDKSAILWDERIARPAIAIYENHRVRFREIIYADAVLDAHRNQVMLGDECGFIINVDIRSPNKVVNSRECLKRPIRKLLPNGENLAIIGDTNEVQVINISSDAIIYTNKDSQDFVRDGVWSTKSDLLTVGFEGRARVHNIQ